MVINPKNKEGLLHKFFGAAKVITFGKHVGNSYEEVKAL
jgi:hypothetical protein